MKRSLLVLLAVVSACEEVTTLEPLNPASFDAVTQQTMLELSAAPAFADERGGGVFVDLAGRVVRVRANGMKGVLEAHPGNTVLPGPASGVWALGPSNSLVSTSRGLFVADQGWLIAPAWQNALPAEGLKSTTLDGDGVARDGPAREGGRGLRLASSALRAGRGLAGARAEERPERVPRLPAARGHLMPPSFRQTLQ